MTPEERQRLLLMTQYERAACAKGFKRIAGLDEAGRGPLAGPVVAAVCMLPPSLLIPHINDSKQLTPKVRKTLFDQITSHSDIVYAVGIISSEEIDRINIYQATIQAMLQAISLLTATPDYLLVDGMKLSHPLIPSEKIVKGDALSQSIAAASIIAKETRDDLMRQYHLRWPNYGFDQHKGYGTEKHVKALENHGPCPIHRFSFGPIQKLYPLEKLLENDALGLFH